MNKPMLNLLPEDIRNHHKRRVVSRAIFVWGLGALFLLLSGLMSLVPAYSYTKVTSSLDTEEAKTQQKTNERSEMMQEDLQNDMKIAQHIEGYYLKTGFTAFQRLLEEKLKQHSSIAYEDMTFNRSEKGNAITIRGSATQRELLIAFVKDLQAQPEFASASVPISDLAGREGLFKFTLSIQMKP
jgi:multidrug efflux pump subunit AcrB